MPVSHRLRRYLPILVALVFLLAITKSTNFGDTKWYARHLLAYQTGNFREEGSGLWEFGHLLERPTAYVIYRAVNPAAHAILGWTDYLVARTCLVVISMICALLIACLFQAIAVQAGLRLRQAFSVALAGLCLNGLLTFAPAGTAYIPGLMFLTWALWLSTSAAAYEETKVASAVWAGVALALSVSFWFPYVLSAPAVLLVGLCWARSDWNWKSRESLGRMRWCGTCILICACVILILYSVAALALGIHSIEDFRSWFGSASHGGSQHRNLFRLVSGLPRGFVSIEGGIAFKRYLLHDPYARVTLLDLVRFGIWKLFLFYGVALCLVGNLIRSPRGRVALALFGAGVAPVLAFALSFEAGSVERYLAIYPFLVLALAVAFAEPAGQPAPRILAALLFVIGLVNTAVMWRPTVLKEWSGESGRMQLLRAETKSAGQIWLLPNDRLFLLPEVFPFDPLSRGAQLPLDEIVRIANEALPKWREHFASRTLIVWEQGGQTWMSKRLLADSPQAEWGWTEGDDPRISWNQLAGFARGLEIAGDAGGHDGFVRLADTPTARLHLRALLQSR